MILVNSCTRACAQLLHPEKGCRFHAFAWTQKTVSHFHHSPVKATVISLMNAAHLEHFSLWNSNLTNNIHITKTSTLKRQKIQIAKLAKLPNGRCRRISRFLRVLSCIKCLLDFYTLYSFLGVSHLQYIK